MEAKPSEVESEMGKEPQEKVSGNVASEANKDHENSTDLNSKPSGASFNENGMFIRETGISWPMCAFFLVCDLAGGGIVAIPFALKNMFLWPGIIVALIIAGVSTFTSVLIGKCWSILQQRHIQYRKHCRQVYAEIGNKAIGKWMKTVVSWTININQFGVSAIYLILSAKSITDAINQFTGGKSPHFCVIILILAAILLPFTYLKSPENFWWATLGGMFCSVGAVILIIVGSGMDFGLCHQEQWRVWDQNKPNAFSILSALGTFVFAYGGHSSFVTIQHDMKRPFDFTKSTYLAFGMILFLYMPMGIVANLAYGSTIHDSIINSLQNVYVQQGTNFLLLSHFLLTFLLVLNPLNQEIEELVHADHHFGWQRVGVRTGVMALLLFFSLSLPNFGPLLDLVGASTTLLTVLIYPVLFYLYLNASGRIYEEKKALAMSSKNNVDSNRSAIEEYPRPTFVEMIRYNNRLFVIVGFIVMAFGVAICFSASASAVANLVGTTENVFVKPCYVQWFKPDAPKPFPTLCCGLYGTLKQQTNKDKGRHCQNPFNSSLIH